MNCPFCRNQIPDGAEFCPGCGANLSQQPMNNVQPQQPMNNIQPQQPMQQPINNIQPQQPVYNTPNEQKKVAKKDY